jgi:MATE family multidrug resistance protein
MAGAQLSQLAMTTTDVAFVGRLHEGALAAMAVGQASYGLFMAFGIGLMAAVSPLAAQAYGAGRRDAASRPLGIGIWCALIYGFLSWLALYQIDHLYRYLGYHPEVERQATLFVRTIMLGLPAFFVFLAAKNFLDSTSRPRLPFLVAFLAIGLNAFVAYALVFGSWGMPSFGVVGVGLTTSLVNLVMAAALLALVWKELPPGFWRSPLDQAGEFLAVGLPVACSLLMEVGLFVTAALLMGKLGTEEAAAHLIVITCASSTFMVPLGISFAGSARVGHAVGAGEFHRVRVAGLAAIGLGAGCMMCSGALFALIPETLVEIFWNPDGDPGKVRAFAIELLLIAGIFQIFDGLQVTASGALRGMKDVRAPLVVAFVSYWLVGLSVAYYLAFFTPFRHRGVWTGLLTGLACAGITLAIRFAILSGRLARDPQLQRMARSEVARGHHSPGQTESL